MNDTPNALPTATVRRKAARPKVPPFARYRGTSAWRHNRRRVREYAKFQAARRQAERNAAANP